MSIADPFDGQDDLTRAAHLAIARAKKRGGDEVTPDDLLAGLLQAEARFGIVLLGPLTIDLDEMGEERLDETDAVGGKVAYSAAAAALFDRAAAVAKRDRSSTIEPVHMLAAFSEEDSGLMGRLKSRHGFDSTGWRAALARWQEGKIIRRDRAAGGSPVAVKELLSPDDAAEFLSVHTQTVRGYIRSGKLPAHRLAGERAVRIRRQDLLDLLEPYEPD